ncbi:MAG: signal peptidase I [Kiritimatiellaeota bacterium]|nr:signal peptidase I [Kiritimatiellota bacterium]
MRGILGLVILIVVVMGMWKMYVKGGKPGWGCLIPFYNAYLLVKIAGKPGWWFFLLLVPLVNIVVWIIVLHGVSVNFGKGVGFTIGLILLPFVFYPILGFGSAEYGGKVAPAAS